jgi:endoglucanase
MKYRGAPPSAISSTRRVRNGLNLFQRMQLFNSGELRGIGVVAWSGGGSSYVQKDFSDLRTLGVNVVRVPIHLTRNGSGYDWPEAEVAYVEQVLDYGELYRFRVIVVLVPLPMGQTSEWWDTASLQTSIINTWVGIANRLKVKPMIQAYDLINEPVADVYTQARVDQWKVFAQAIATPLRAADPGTPIMVEPCWWGLPGVFQYNTPITVSGLVYSFHMYEPQTITHQGINGYPQGVTYPNVTDTKAAMSADMANARAFSSTYGIPLFVGEFACIRWAPDTSSQQYLTDVIDLMNAEKWGWSYFAWRTYEGWDAEIPSNIAQGSGTPASRTPTSASYLLLKAAMQTNIPV